MTTKPFLTGRFITLPVVSVTSPDPKNALQEPIIDRFDMNVIAVHIIGVNGLDLETEDASNGAQSAVHFHTSSGMRTMLSDASVEDIMAALDRDNEFISFNVVSPSQTTNAQGERVIKRYTGYVLPEYIVAVNDLDTRYPQVTEDVRSIIYFKPVCGLRPTLSSDLSSVLIEKVNGE